MFTPKNAVLDAIAKRCHDRIELLERVLTNQTIVYIDYANVRGVCKRLAWQIDLQKLKDFLDSFGVIECRFYFGTYSKDEKSQRFMKFVHSAGYKVRTKSVQLMNWSIDATSISSQS